MFYVSFLKPKYVRYSKKNRKNSIRMEIKNYINWVHQQSVFVKRKGINMAEALYLFSMPYPAKTNLIASVVVFRRLATETVRSYQ